MGFTGSAFSVRSSLVGRSFAQNGPQDQENPVFQGFWPISGLKTDKYFQCAPLEGGTKGQTRKNREIAPFSTKPHSLKPQRKTGSNTFWWLGPGNFQVPRPLQKPVNRDFLEKLRVNPPDAVRVRKLRNANAVPMSQNNPQKSPVAPSYGQNGFFCQLGP